MSTTVASNETECFSLILSKVPLPNLIFAISVESDKTMSNNRIFKGLLDTGSQCSILTEDTIEKSGLSAHVKKRTVTITLTGATGCQKHPFKGELTVNVRFLCSNYCFSKHVKQKFFVSSSIKQNIIGSDLIASVEGNISYKQAWEAISSGYSCILLC